MKKLAFFFFYVFVAKSAGAADLPSLGDSEDSIVSKIDRRQLGKAIMYRLRNSDKYLDDPEIEGYIKRIGYRLVSNSPVASEPIEFFVISDKSVNAFALPGGFIGVHTGLIQKVRSESELASVLAHEIAHVSQRHIARMIASQKRTGMASMAALAVAILASRSSGSASAAAITAAQAGLIQNKLNFSREYEREADRIGLQIIRNSSFDEHAVESFLKFMQQTTESSIAGVPSYMRTHPFFYERLADIQNRLQNAPYKQIPDGIEFKLVRARIDGIASMVRGETATEFDYRLGIMVETPRAALRADDIALNSAFLSFGTNDLTQMTYGLSRDDAGRFMSDYVQQGVFPEDPFHTLDIDGVGELLKMGVTRARDVKSDILLSICGEHGGSPESIAFCREIGMDYVSCSPFRVPVAKLAAAQLAIKDRIDTSK